MLKTCVLLAAVTMCVMFGVTRAACAADAPPMIDTPKVLAGDYVDTSSIESIVEGVFKRSDLKTDEQRVMNFYNWYRRVVYPYRNMGGTQRDVTKSINSFGFSLCGSQAAVCTTILKAAGYRARNADISAGPEWGHTVWEVFYDDKWHLFDAMTAFYVMTRGAADNPPHVASVAEIQADPTLVSKAVEEKRCGPEFVYTARNHEITLAQREQFLSETKGQDVPWSMLLTRTGTLVQMWEKAAAGKITKEDKHVNCIRSGEESAKPGASTTPGVLDIKLKANERYVRMWQGIGKWQTTASFVKWSPANMAAGDNEKFDVANFRFFEPYRQEKPNPFNKAIYRSYGNGYLEWTPKTAEQLKQGLGKIENLSLVPPPTTVPGPTTSLFVQDRAKPASFVLPVKSPYAVVEVELALELDEPGVVGLTFTPVNNGQRGNPKKVWSSDAPPASAPDSAKVEQTVDGPRITIPLENWPSPIYEYELKVDITKTPEDRHGKSPSGLVAVKQLKTTFQLNPMALPGLVPGANKIRVSAAQPTKLAGSKLLVTYSWFDAPEWKNEHISAKELIDLPAEYEIALPAGEKLPKMKSVELFLKAD